MGTLLLVFAAAALAFANGANDVFKPVATLYGSRTLGYRAAILFAAGACFLGALTSVVFAEALIKAFSGKGLVPDTIVGNPAFAISVGLGAALTIMLATVFGFPVSTTHALTGALVGAGLVGAASDLNLGALGAKFALPLLVSPFLALGATALLYPLLSRARRALGVTRETWIQLPQAGEWIPQAEALERGLLADPLPDQNPRGEALARSAEPRVPAFALAGGGAVAAQAERYSGSVAGVSAEQLLNAAHVLSASAVGFARGLNDTPKIAALLLLLPAVGSVGGNALVATLMVVGGLLCSRRVAETMSNEITTMNAGQGFSGNLVSAILVTCASRLGVPVSTTHVTCGALFGVGLATRQARWKTIGTILIAWITTLPLAALLAALLYWILG